MEKVDLDAKYIIACSGGPDSMALLDMLYKKNMHLIIAFVNYHKREASNYEEKKVKEYASLRNIPIYIKSALKNDHKGNFQSWARKVRYDFFVEILNKENAKGIFVAHHLDDLLETFIFQEKRKGIYSYYGLKEYTYYKNKLIIRPLLNYRKSELLQYCIKNNVFYSIDESNLKDDYSRNKIRHQIVENLSNEEIKIYLQKISLLNKKIESEINKKDEFINNKIFSLSSFYKLNENIQKRIIYELLNINKIYVSGKEIENIINFLYGKTNHYLLKNGLVIYKNYDEFEIVKNTNNAQIINVKSPCEIDNNTFYFDLVNGTTCFFIKENSYPLTIKTASKDEIVKIGKIHKKVNRLFIDEKIKVKYRSCWPCIYDKNNYLIFFPRKEEIYANNKLVFKMKGGQNEKKE